MSQIFFWQKTYFFNSLVSHITNHHTSNLLTPIAILPIYTFSHLLDGVPIELWALDILHLQLPHLGKAILSDVNHWAVESVL